MCDGLPRRGRDAKGGRWVELRSRVENVFDASAVFMSFAYAVAGRVQELRLDPVEAAHEVEVFAVFHRAALLGVRQAS